jgi:hypothetical protein
VHYVANPTISSVLIDFVFDLHRRSFVLRLAYFFVTTPRLDSAAAVGSSGCETHRHCLPTCYSHPAADWIGVTIVDRDRFGSCRPLPPALCSASIGSMLLYTDPARLSLLHRLDGFHSAWSRGDMRRPRSCPASGGGC